MTKTVINSTILHLHNLLKDHFVEKMELQINTDLTWNLAIMD